MIRRGFIEADLIEAIIVLPGKLFYGNNVPGCLVLLNKADVKTTAELRCKQFMRDVQGRHHRDPLRVDPELGEGDMVFGVLHDDPGSIPSHRQAKRYAE